MSAPDNPPTAWTRSQVPAAALAAGGVLMVLAALAGRSDLAALAAVLVGAGALGVARRVRGDIDIAVLPPTDGPTLGAATSGPGTLRARIELTRRTSQPAAALTPDAAVVTVTRRDLPVARVVLAVGDTPREIPVTARTVHTGPQEVVTATVAGADPLSGAVTEASAPAVRTTVVLPSAGALDQLPSPNRLRGLTGPHRSVRPGHDGDMHDIHPFVPGDQVRRIDWRVTARRSPDLTEPYVRRDHALAEASVMLVIDSRDDVGPDPATWSGAEPVRPDEATSLDIARAAAASVARAVLDITDRVGVDDLGTLRRPLIPGGGRRQLDRIRHALAVSRPRGTATNRVRSPRLPTGAFIAVFSTFLDDAVAVTAADWRRSGHRVLAIDVLPALRTRHLADRQDTAVRLLLLEREERLADLRSVQVDVVAWRDSPAAALTALARRARAQPGTRARR